MWAAQPIAGLPLVAVLRVTNLNNAGSDPRLIADIAA